MPPLVQRDLVERAHLERRVEAGVVHEDVDAAALRDGLVDHPLHVGFVRDVHREPDAAVVRPGGLLGATQVGDDDACSLGREAVGERAADALRRARDDGDLTVE